jgi:hypothetical protein
MPEMNQVLDRNGKPVLVGSRVRVVAIAAFLERDLPREEWERVRTMLGEVFEVYEIDKWGGAWVEKQFPSARDQYQSHSLSLASDEMELVEDQT